MMKDRILGLPRNVFFLGLTSFFNDFSSEMVASVFPAFFISVLKAGAESLGLVEGVAEAARSRFSRDPFMCSREGGGPSSVCGLRIVSAKASATRLGMP